MLSNTDWSKFEDQGYLRLGQPASNDELETLRTRIDDIMLGKVRYPGMYFQLDSETGNYGDVGTGGDWAAASLNYRKIEQLELDPVYLKYMQHPLFRSITRRVYGEDVSIYRAMFMNKPALHGTTLPYHQDGGTQWGLDRHPLITIWTALDEASIANGCMEVIPGSHKHGLFSERGHTITAEQEAEFARDTESIYLEAKPGEAILLHNWMLHRSGVNTTVGSRRAFTVCYMHGETHSNTDIHLKYPCIFGRDALIT